MSDVVMAEIRKDYLYHLVLKGERADGRRFDEYRDIVLETGLIRKADGSALVKLGKTQVMVGVKIQPGEPFSDTPNKGVIITNAELVPLASPSFEPGPPNEVGIELARVVDRGVRESGAIDLEALCITTGEKVWIIFIDVHILDDCGNLMDASSLGAIAALMTAKVPAAQYGLGEDYPLPVKDVPVATTAVEFGDAIIFDPDTDEESVADTKLTVITTADGSICGMQKSGPGSISQDAIHRIVDIACERAKEIREKFLEV
ncbi:exosome complex protein Rrp42 [Methanotrichaceae archaeon M04Ac]|jgi:exosome complex component RRP42|uniref:Exosome complex component Rrp42 n=1 Tax=Candidatus Methanocrinis alkalitolerans TaxID=3033395 RepID=A0ABT5XCT2_9EURY|nr:exosome complex protein Rrp42 [Candidatus Methanocrinis alkalitolerans]MCR3883501.1 exosome complex protein Rrp42 [Methanothrix sp.]MDF0592518.1 exosome complex protein Rrp42 [Candidatus Methanocrinis alkalitolerans]